MERAKKCMREKSHHSYFIQYVSYTQDTPLVVIIKLWVQLRLLRHSRFKVSAVYLVTVSAGCD